MKVPPVIKKMLGNKYVLYVVLFLSITNILGYLASQDFNALTFFVVVAFLTTYFSKNMIIVLLVAMVSTNFLSMSKSIPKTIEAMTNKDKHKENIEHKEEEHKKETMGHKESGTKGSNGVSKESLKARNKLQPASLEENKVNYQETLEAAYDNLDKILDSGAIQKMTKDTDKLMDRQNKLAGQIEKFAPLLHKAEGMLKNLPMDKMNNMISRLGGMGMLAGASDSKKE
jgi:hypothetical protein